MKQALVRTAFSPVIREVLDFAVALYDPAYRLLAQAPSLPLFMGTLDVCAAEAVAAVGGPEAIEPGDAILYNWPYGTGSHPQDVAMVMPVFLDGTHLGYAVAKAHWLDIGGRSPYSTDTTDVFQEGTIYPGIKVCRRNKVDPALLRFILANSRVPNLVEGDMNAQLVALRTGSAAFERVVRRFGTELFWNAVERMFDHGEAMVRDVFARLPDGRYIGHGVADDDGIDTKKIRFDIAVEIAGSDVTVDFTAAPDQHAGPMNSPAPAAISASRIAIAMLTGSGGSPNEGHFRPIEVLTRPGSMFHPLPPAPTFLYGLPALQSIEVIYQALVSANPAAVPACSGGCLFGISYWGQREGTGRSWVEGSPHPVGQGGSAAGDGGTMMHLAMAGTRFAPVEVWEARNPWVVERLELAPDSCGPGQYRGGLGLDISFRMLEDTHITSSIDRSKTRPWGILGGGDGRANSVSVMLPDGSIVALAKRTDFLVPKGSLLSLRTGGGGGYGAPEDRDPARVRDDLRGAYITEDFARRYFSHALERAPETPDKLSPLPRRP
jgi:N-methylhydantoinase B